MVSIEDAFEIYKKQTKHNRNAHVTQLIDEANTAGMDAYWEYTSGSVQQAHALLVQAQEKFEMAQRLIVDTHPLELIARPHLNLLKQLRTSRITTMLSLELTLRVIMNGRQNLSFWLIQKVMIGLVRSCCVLRKVNVNRMTCFRIALNALGT